MGLLQALGLTTNKKLKETGIAIPAVIAEVAINNSVSINGRNPRKLICEGVIPSGEKRYFESANVSAMTHPSVVGQSITVYIDPQNPNKYYVDAEAYK